MKILLTAIFMLTACSTEVIRETETVYKDVETETVCTTTIQGPKGVDCADPECSFKCWWIKECKEVPVEKIDDGIETP